MPLRLLDAVRSRLVRSRTLIGDVVLLEASLMAGQRLLGTETVPPLDFGLCLAAALILPLPTAGDPGVGRWLRGLPRQIVVAGVAGLLDFLGQGGSARGLWAFAGWSIASLVSNLAPIESGWVGRIKGSARRALGRSNATRACGLDVLLGEGMVIAGVLALIDRLAAGSLPARTSVTAAAFWIAARLAVERERPLALTRRYFGLVATLIVALIAIGNHGRAAIAGPLWVGILLLGYRWALGRQGSRSQAVDENLRWIALAAVGAWLFHPFAMAWRLGTEDAQWYETMTADLIAQVRHGVFPVFVGQSPFQFNGSIYPLRIAPGFHTLAAFVDILTGMSLPAGSVQNLLLILCGLGALATAYAALASLLPDRRWLAWSLAVGFVACPGVLGIVYNTDLYMSWTTVPLVPIVWWAVVRSFGNGNRRTLITLGLGLGLLWWGHSPIALWVTFFAGASQVVRLVVKPLGRAEWKAAVWGAGAFLLIAAYPIGSVLLFPPEPGLSAASFQRAEPATIVHFLRSVMPAILLPVSAIGRSLGDFQLGYFLWGCLAVACAAAWRTRDLAAFVLGAMAVGALGLLVPVPGLDLRVWSLVPAFFRNTTSNWAMNRLYLVASSMIIFSFAAAWRSRPKNSPAMTVLVAVGLIWSLGEASKFVEGSQKVRIPESQGLSELWPENTVITRYAYLVFPGVPAAFTNGVTDPGLENQLLRPSDFAVISSNKAEAVRSGTQVAVLGFALSGDGDPTHLELDRKVVLEPHARYLLQFAFNAPAEVGGTLVLDGNRFHRVYALPEYGGPASFGAGGRHSNLIPLENSSEAPEDLRVVDEFPAGTNAAALLPYATVRLLRYGPKNLPVRVKEWIPYEASVDSPEAALLETPRSFQSRYRAWVDGKRVPVVKSPNDLVCVPVPAGRSEVQLTYVPPPGLVGLWWCSALGIIGCGIVVFRLR